MTLLLGGSLLRLIWGEMFAVNGAPLRRMANRGKFPTWPIYALSMGTIHGSLTAWVIYL